MTCRRTRVTIVLAGSCTGTTTSITKAVVPSGTAAVKATTIDSELRRNV